MVMLVDPILAMRPPPDGIELTPRREPKTLEASSRMVVKAVKHKRGLDWAGSRSAMPGGSADGEVRVDRGAERGASGLA